MVTPDLTPKGGVGKTTISTHKAIGLASIHKKRVLLLDMDPQSNASALLFPEYEKFIEQPDAERLTIYNAIVNREEIPIYQSKYDLLDISPSHLLLSGADNDLAIARDHTEERLMIALEHVKKEYDHIIIDCPPNLGLLTINALMAADNFVIVAEPGRFALDSINQLQTIIDGLIVGEYKKQIQPLGIVFNKKSPTLISKETLSTLRDTFGDLVFQNVVNRSTDIEKAQAAGISIWEYAPESNAANDLKQLISEIYKL